MTGKALRGNKVTYGDFGLQATEPAWITSNQIEAARVAMTRYCKDSVKYGSKFSLISLLQQSLLKHEWVQVKVHPSTG